MDTRTHWKKIYTTKAPHQVSWYRPHLETSLALILRAAGDRTASIIDMGGGESTLVDDLLEEGFQNITVLDVSQAAIDVNKTRLGEKASGTSSLSSAGARQIPELPLGRGSAHSAVEAHRRWLSAEP